MNKRGEVTSFGRWLSRQRKARDLTQEDLAERIGCSVWTIQKMEVGNRRPSKQVAQLLADYFGIPPEGRAAFLQFARGHQDQWQGASGEQTPALLGSQTADHALVVPLAPRVPGPQEYPPNNLPAQLTSFVGRDAELPRIRDLMLTAEVRLLTLTGPPGTGKTRLALQVAAELLKEAAGEIVEQGVFFVNLAPISDCGLVTSEIAQTLAVRESGGQSLLEGLKEYLRDKRLLLVLDNFEQVVEAAPAVGELLMSAPKVKMMATSRVPLHIRGEKEFSVPPLQLPDTQHLPSLERLTRYEAIRLFTERASDVKADFEVTGDNAAPVAQICARLDGLPLAIELAAARAKFLSPQTILGKLASRLELLTGGPRDLPARQRTLRSSIEWSYELLNGEEKKLFRRLAVFQGGRSLEAIEAVCYPEGVPGINVLDGVSSLVDKGLLKREESVGGAPRFVMLETIHEYAREKLDESGEGEGRRREHAIYFMTLVEEAEPHLVGARQKEWLDRLDEEHDNLRYSLTWARRESEKGNDGAVEIGLRLAGALWRFWNALGHFSEGREELERALSWRGTLGGITGGIPEIVNSARAKALHGAGMLAYKQGDLSTAQSRLEKSLAIYRELGNRGSIAYVLSSMGHIANTQEDEPKARALYEEALAIFKELEDKQGIATTLSNLGDVAMVQGDYTAARVLFEESLALDRELGDRSVLAHKLFSLGIAAMQKGKYADARLFYGEALVIFRELEDKRGIAQALGELGWLAQGEGDFSAASRLLEESVATYRELGHKQGISSSLAGLGAVANEQGNYAEARAFFEESLALDRELGDNWGVSARLNNLGVVAMLEGKYADARSYYEEGLALCKEFWMESTRFLPWWLVSLGHVAFLAGDYSAARPNYEEGMKVAQKLGDVERVMQCLVGLGGVAGIGMGHAEKGARLLGASEAVGEAFGARLWDDDRLVYDRAMASIRAQLGEEAFSSAWQAGRLLTLSEQGLEQVIAYALERV